MLHMRIGKIMAMVLLFTLFALLRSVLCNEYALRSYLFDSTRHHPHVIPRKSPQPITVNLSWMTATVAGFDEIEGKFDLMGSLIMTWRNELITWDPEQYNVSSIVVFGKEVWTPPIYVANKMDCDFLDTGLQNDLLRIDHTGLVSATHSGDLAVFCDLDPTNFPFDTQTCKLLFSVSVYSFSEVRLQFTANPFQSLYGIMTKLEHPIWTITGSKAVAFELLPFAFVEFCLFRKPLYYSFTMLGPSLLLNCLTMISFLIPSTQGEKISCGMTIFLAFVVFLVQVGDVIPKNSNAVPVIGKYYLLSIVSSVVMVLQTIIHSCFAANHSSIAETKIEPFVYNEEKIGVDGSLKQDVQFTKRRFLRDILCSFRKEKGLKIFNFVCFLISFLLVLVALVLLLSTDSACIS